MCKICWTSSGSGDHCRFIYFIYIIFLHIFLFYLYFYIYLYIFQSGACTQRNLSQILLNQIKIRLYLPRTDWFETRRTLSVWFQINRCMVNTIWFQLDLIRFQKRCVCAQLEPKSSSLWQYSLPYKLRRGRSTCLVPFRPRSGNSTYRNFFQEPFAKILIYIYIYIYRLLSSVSVQKQQNWNFEKSKKSL